MLKKIKANLYKNSTIYILCFSIIAVNFIAIACQHKVSHQDRVNYVSNAMNIFNRAWEITDIALLDMAKEGKLSRANKDLRDKVAKVQIQLNKNWKLVPQTDASIEAFVLSPDFLNGISLLVDLMAVAEVNDVEFEDLINKINLLQKQKEQ